MCVLCPFGIQEDWEVIQDAEEADTEECVVRSFGGMCAFSNEVMGQETEGFRMRERVANLGNYGKMHGHKRDTKETKELTNNQKAQEGKRIEKRK